MLLVETCRGGGDSKWEDHAERGWDFIRKFGDGKFWDDGVFLECAMRGGVGSVDISVAECVGVSGRTLLRYVGERRKGIDPPILTR